MKYSDCWKGWWVMDRKWICFNQSELMRAEVRGASGSESELWHHTFTDLNFGEFHKCEPVWSSDWMILTAKLSGSWLLSCRSAVFSPTKHVWNVYINVIVGVSVAVDWPFVRRDDWLANTSDTPAKRENTSKLVTHEAKRCTSLFRCFRRCGTNYISPAHWHTVLWLVKTMD